MSFTGVILMYESQITDYIERNVRRVMPSADGKRLSYDELIAKVRAANPEARPAMIMVKSDPTASVAVNLGRENTVFVNPYNGQTLGRTVGHPRFHARRRRLAPLARHRRRRPRHGSRHHRCVQSGVFLARRYRRLSLVAAQLAMAWIENESADQYPLARQSARLELAQRHRILVFNGAGRAHADRGGHVLSLGK